MRNPTSELANRRHFLTLRQTQFEIFLIAQINHICRERPTFGIGGHDQINMLIVTVDNFQTDRPMNRSRNFRSEIGLPVFGSEQIDQTRASNRLTMAQL
ncbi:MAG: Uncharacterised protein [Hyphomonas sp. TMED17]|nr:MAG: Uncharacterised protein [Hyphomonas sp. TMED17]